VANRSASAEDVETTIEFATGGRDRVLVSIGGRDSDCAWIGGKTVVIEQGTNDVEVDEVTSPAREDVDSEAPPRQLRVADGYASVRSRTLVWQWRSSDRPTGRALVWRRSERCIDA
jgi:hypothetical protein